MSEMQTDVAPASPPPGWYEVPGDTSRRRYWDGNAWTDHWEKVPWSMAAHVGMALAIVFPPIGFLVGLALLAGRDPKAHKVVLVSILVPVAVVMAGVVVGFLVAIGESSANP